MKRMVLLSAVVATALLVAGGTALAATLACNGGKCVGGDGPDTMIGSAVATRSTASKAGISCAEIPAPTC